MAGEVDLDDDVIEEGGSAKGRAPPYIGYSTFKTLLNELKTNGVPPQIDRSVLTRFAGGVQGQLMHALRSLALVDDAKKPTPMLKQLVDAYETPAYAEILRPIMASTYPFAFNLDLLTATPSMFADAFKNSIDAKEEVLRKCRTFFLHAARDIGIAVGPRIEKAKFPRSRTNGTRRAKQPKPDTVTPPPPTQSATGGVETITDKALEYKLIDLMREDGVGEEERGAIWTLVQYLTAKAKKEKAASVTPTA